MATFCVDISQLDDRTLAFFGYRFVEENQEFKVYVDKFGEDHIVSKTRPRLYVEDVNDAAYMTAEHVIALPDDLGEHC